MSSLQELLAKLISFKSLTPHDEGCQNFMIEELKRFGFQCETFNKEPVSNFFARYGTQPPLLVFAGHTDVVPPGEDKLWNTPPFQLTKTNMGLWQGRGVADMKGSLAAMISMAQSFIKNNPNFPGSLGFLITSGEEGDHYDLGTPIIMDALYKRGISIDYCVIGEPSSTNTVGDVIKIGRRGSLSGKLYLQGKQGHVAYPHLAKNPIHAISPALAELSSIEWDTGNNHFPPTTFQITHIESGGKANNIIPGELILQFNCRFSTEQNSKNLKEKILHCFQKHGLEPTIEWRLSGEPFLTSQGRLLEKTIQAIHSICAKEPELSTSGGTSDGRFIAPYGVEVLELGPVNKTIHQVNESIDMQELEKLAQIYYEICELIFDNKIPRCEAGYVSLT
jgi:succinyl-diaminopimelate desuccinylase